MEKPEESASPQQEQEAKKERPAVPERPQLEVDDSNINTCYGNFCRVTGTPEELLIDFGLNGQPMGVPTEPIKISQRLVCNFYTAKRLLAALSMAVQRHEAVFGVLETDIQKRVIPSASRPAPPQTQS